MNGSCVTPLNERSALSNTGKKIFNCDLCDSAAAGEVPHAREYTGGQPIHICSDCGFVYVRERRDPQAIAELLVE